ncbi:MAG: hypothetical protein HC780_19495 [Leptolyngbyaceae cyanobacterium CSU_1_3]|nr:hypothetical protein [Leptolyngbyaceae cyanobacterium CSU_1_3]
MLKKLLPIALVTMSMVAPVSMAMGQDNPLCYMDNPKGTIDLSKICGKTPVNTDPAGKKSPDDSQGSDGTTPPQPAKPIDPSVQLIPGQTMEPPIKLRREPSPVWNLLPDLPQPPQEKPPAPTSIEFNLTTYLPPSETYRSILQINSVSTATAQLGHGIAMPLPRLDA